MFADKKYITLLLFIFFLSCDKDGTVFTGISEPEEEYINNLSGDGCSPSTLCYPLEEIYYNFSNNNAVSQDYYKYNLIDIVTGNYSADSENVLELNSFNSSYFAAVPSSSITSGNEEDDIIIFPSKTKHATNINLTENPRISISGDVTIMLANSYGHERLMPHYNNWQQFKD